jgi:hypothetical protein
MGTRLRSIGKALSAAAVVAALGLGANQAFASSGQGRKDPCVCVQGGPSYQCDVCCDGGGALNFCTAGNYCLCG